MRKRFSILTLIIGILLILLIAVGIVYIAYINFFKEQSEIILSGPLSINYLEGASIRVKGEKTSHITIVNNSDKEVYYFIEFKNIKNKLGDVEYFITDNNDFNIRDNLEKFNKVVSSYINIGPNESKNYEITFYPSDNFIMNLDVNIDVENLEEVYFADKILANNTIQNSSKTVIGKEIATENEGLIKTYDDLGTTYYFRGKVDNNYVSINNLLFRIVKVNGDGSVKLVYDGMLEQLGKYSLNGDSREFIKSDIYMDIETWINNNLYDYSDFISSSKYCNDNIKNSDKYDAYSRIIDNNIISYICLTDRFINKFGLLTVDEVIMAGGMYDKENTSFYLYSGNVNNDIFLMTGAKELNTVYYTFAMSNRGRVETTIGSNVNKAIRPVITLIKNTKVSGSGTKNDPYVMTN